MIGSTVSHYRVLDRLGGGGMGVVYKAEDLRLNRFVALKVLPPELTDRPGSRERFTREARAAGSLDHPNICTIHEIDETPEGEVFICMAYVDGESLRARLARGPATVEETVSVVTQAAAGLSQAHRHGVVHRDVKPANLMLTRDGVVKIVDFGLASLAGHAHLTMTGQAVGTAAYMSPEQARGAPVDARSDLWSLGIVAYEMLSGQRPFAGESDVATLHAVVYDTPRPLEELRPDLPPKLLAAVGRCLAKEPGERYQGAEALVADLEPLRRELGMATPATLLDLPPSRPAARGRPLPGPLRRALRPAVATPLAAVAVAAVFLAATTPGRRLVRSALGTSAVPRQQHMAVLPFTNVGDDPANRPFCDGLTEILASTLTQLERFRGELWVVPASEVRARDVKSAGEARDVFNVNLAVTGSVQRQGGRFRLAINLVDTSTLRQLSSDVIDETQANLPALEDRVVAAMARMLDVRLKPADTKELTAGGTRVAAAYDLYVQALGELGAYQGERRPQKAAELFQQAIDLDPSFALAHAGLANACLELYWWKKDPALVAQATASARRAGELNDRLAEVHATLGAIQRATGKYEDSAREYRRALEIDPRSSGALTGLAGALDALGNTADAEATFRQAIALKPGYWLTSNRLGNFYASHGRYADAEKQFKEVIALTPENVWGYTDLGALYFTLGRYAEARGMFEKTVSIRPSYMAWSNLGTLAFIQRDWAEAVAKFEQARALDDRDYLLWGNLGIAYRWLGGHEPQSRAMLTNAVSLAEKQLAVNPRDTTVLADMAGYHALLGQADRAAGCLRQIEAEGRTKPDLAMQIADVYTDLGLRDKAIAWIGIGLDLGFPPAQLSNLPALEGLLGDPRVQALLRSRGPQKGQGSR